jgi:hypothetical protein
MTRNGPVTKDSTTVALGLAQVRLGASAANITSLNPVLTSASSIGALANTKFTSTIEVWKLESGFPLMPDASIPLREKASLECAFKEITPMNLAFARGIDATSGYTAAHSGEVPLGAMVAPAYIRMEAFYTYPDGVNEMVIIFPRAQASPNVELDLKAEDAAASPVTFEATGADINTSGGSSIWNGRSLGRILFRAIPA